MPIVTSSDLRDRYTELTNRYLPGGEPIYVTENGRCHAVLLGIDEYESVCRELLALRIDRGVCEAKDGLGVPLENAVEQIRNELDL